MSGTYDSFSGSITAELLTVNPDAIPEPDTLYIFMRRGERRIANELRKQFGGFKHVVIDVSGERHEFSADSLLQMLEDYEDWNTRAERTCHSTTDDSAWCFTCSACGKSCPRHDLTRAYNHGKINFCPNCGAKVVE